jgi:hypothetical protein
VSVSRRLGFEFWDRNALQWGPPSSLAGGIVEGFSGIEISSFFLELKWKILETIFDTLNSQFAAVFT